MLSTSHLVFVISYVEGLKLMEKRDLLYRLHDNVPNVKVSNAIVRK